MKQFKKLSRFTAAFLSLLTAFSIVPTATITASAQTIYTTNASLTDTSITKNVYLDALGYLMSTEQVAILGAVCHIVGLGWRTGKSQRKNSKRAEYALRRFSSKIDIAMTCSAVSCSFAVTKPIPHFRFDKLNLRSTSTLSHSSR